MEPRYQPYLDVAPEPFRWRLGLRPLDLADWIQIDEHSADELAEQRDVLARHHATAFVALDDIDAEAAEVLESLVDHLAIHHPDLDRDVDRTLHPLDAAGRLVPEDLVLLVERDGTLICGGGSVCFPNRWDLRSKVGRTMAEIHAPVDRLNDQLAGPIDGFLARISPERAYWRLGWGVLDTDQRYQAVDGTAGPRPVGAVPSDHHLRVERETLRRFPDTGCILFTIRTYLTPLTDLRLVEGANGLADAIDALPDDVARYKQLDQAGPTISAWLRQLATTRSQ